MITGEPGVRKDQVARALHAASPVSGREFVVCDGSRTQSDADGVGAWLQLVEKAEGGTVFFRELSQFSATAQGHVLRFLDHVDRMRGERVRVIASINGDVRRLVAEGVLRRDLAERLSAIELEVPPLRTRVEEMGELAHKLLREAEGEGSEAQISEEALTELERREWPGNDREFECVLRMAQLMSRGGRIERGDLPEASIEAERSSERPGVELSGSMKLQDVMEAHVREVLRRCEGNKLRAAEMLGISRSTLYRMLDAMPLTEEVG